METAAEQALGDLLYGEVFATADVDHRALSGTFAVIRPRGAERRVSSGSPMHQNLLADHRMTDHMGDVHALDVVRLSDPVPSQSWRQMPGFAKMQELMGATHQVGVTVKSAPGWTFAISTKRGGT